VESADERPTSAARAEEADLNVCFQLAPDWVPSVDRGAIIKEKFGSLARALGKRTFLGPGNELRLELDIADVPTGLGVVTYLHRGVSIPQGTEVGQVLLEMEEGEDRAFSLIAGQDTAEVWWGYAAPGRRKHRPASLFRDWDAECMGKCFKAGEYYSLISFPVGQLVKSITVRNCTARSGLCVSDLFLTFPEDIAGRTETP